MAAPERDIDDEQPLDPAMERVQAKLRRLMLVSGVTLGVGFLAVLFAVIWRVTREDGPPSPGDVWRSAIELPAGTTLVDTALDGDRIAITLDGPEGRMVHLFHLPSGQPLGAATLVGR